MPADQTVVAGRDVPAALLWDFDGTLVDSERSWHAAEERLMGEWGATITPEQQASLTGNSLRDSAIALMEWAGKDGLDPDEYAGVLNDYALDDMVTVGVDFRPGARELVEECRASGVRCALVSASFTRVLATIVDTLPEGTFAVVVGGDQVTHGKPAAEPYLTAVEKLGLEAEDCLALEDSLPGTQSAEAAGLATIGVPFMQDLEPGPRRAILPTLEGVALADLGRHWQELRHA